MNSGNMTITKTNIIETMTNTYKKARVAIRHDRHCDLI